MVQRRSEREVGNERGVDGRTRELHQPTSNHEQMWALGTLFGSCRQPQPHSVLRVWPGEARDSSAYETRAGEAQDALC